jgi:hypothetical protein
MKKLRIDSIREMFATIPFRIFYNYEFGQFLRPNHLQQLI